MRMRNLIQGDIGFQVRYGFYLIYSIITILYVCLLYALPDTWRSKAGAIMIFSDPAAMGLFFMGAIVLLEKSQRVLNSIAVSPVKVSEYILSKVISLGIISTIVGILIALAVGEESLILTGIGTFLGSVVFTLLALIIGANITSLNQFVLATIPIEIIMLIPPILSLYGNNNLFIRLHPGSIILQLISGNQEGIVFQLLLLILWILGLYVITLKMIKSMFQRVGGVRL